MKRYLLMLLSLFLCLCLLSCGSCNPPVETATPGQMTKLEEGRYRLEENGKVYTFASYAYLPNRMQRTPFAVCEATSQNFYALGDESAASYLVWADPDDYYPYYILTAEGYTLPSVAEMEPTTVIFCHSDEELFWLAPISYMRNATSIANLVSAYTLGEETTLPLIGATTTAELIFSSEKYPEFSYYCTCYRFADGKVYLHERDSDRTVEIDPALVSAFAPFADGEG